MTEEFPRPNLPPMPHRIARLPVARGYPVPWFVHWFHRDGTAFESPDLPICAGDYPDFRVTDGRRMRMAVRQNRCWTCGDVMGKHLAFTVGPMCAINRTSGEPPSHRDCAVFASQACPFLSRPHMVRREAGLPEGVTVRPDMLPRNPEVSMVWMTSSYRVHQDAAGVLFMFGEPSEILFFCEGRKATREEVMRSIDSGLPELQKVAELEGGEAVSQLVERYEGTKQLVEERA